MAITRLRQAGFETNTLLYEVDGVSNVAVAISSVQRKTGSYGILMGSTAVYNWYWLLAAALSQARVGLHFRTGTVNGGTETPDIVSFYSGATPIIRVQSTATGIRVVVGASTVAATAAIAAFGVTGTWVHISIDVKVLVTTGWVRIYVDGVDVVNFSGTTNSGGANFDRVIFGPITASQNYSDSTYMDDVVLDDTTGEGASSMTPDARFLYVLPNGNGNASQWVGSDADSVDNFLLVDDLPDDSDATYVAATSAGVKDTYAMDSLTLPPGWSITAVIPAAIAKKDNAGTTLTLSPVTRLGANENIGAAKALGTSYNLVWDRQPTKPGGGAWTQADLDAMEAGMVTA